jgi:hypothetical protein
MNHRKLVFFFQMALLLSWVEHSHGIHEHSGEKIVEHTLPNGKMRELIVGPGSQQLPGFVRVKMSSEHGLQIAAHRFKPVKGDLRFSLIQAGERYYYQVVERDRGQVRESFVDAVTGELVNPKTGQKFDLE